MENLTTNNEISTRWIETLALEELNMEESGVINFNDHLNPAHLLEESSIRIMDQIREKTEIYVTKFNEYRGGHHTGSQIKLFKISNTVNDFMLFRNSLRLIFARKAHDLISIGFLANGKDLFAARVTDEHGRELPSQNTLHELRAHIGPFNNITWRFNGEIVDIDSMVRHYISEFVRQSAR